MGLFGKIFGGGDDYPPLQKDSPVLGRLRKDIKGLEELAGQIPDRLEIVPGSEGTYVFIGKPPKKFGLAWVKGDEVANFKTLSREKGLSSLDLQPVIERLRDIYQKNREGDRYITKISDRTTVVAAGKDLSCEVEKIIQDVAR